MGWSQNILYLEVPLYLQIAHVQVYATTTDTETCEADYLHEKGPKL